MWDFKFIVYIQKEKEFQGKNPLIRYFELS